jgi:glucose-6-phosphate isomerase
MTEKTILDISLDPGTLRFRYGPGTVGPETEFRSLDAIRPSLLDPHCSGPDPVYGIAMDVARAADLPDLKQRMLLYGVVAYAAGRLGQEPVRSQGHVHAIAPHSGWPPPEIFEIFEGKAIVYAQQAAEDDPGRAVAVTMQQGDVAVVPPGWAHCVINADPDLRMVFGAWCDRQYGFVYDGVRRHGGLAWFPVFNAANAIEWRANPRYCSRPFDIHPARAYPELGLAADHGIYEQYLRNPDPVMWVADPARKATVWDSFAP